MKIAQLFLALLCLSSILMGQNLVPNESFETIVRPPNRWMGNRTHFQGLISQWHSPTQGSPDILHVNSMNKLIPNRPNFDLTPHQPRTGNVMVGIKTFGCKTQTTHCKEYLQVKLKAPLIPGVEYYGEFYVNPIASSVRVHDIGMAFSDTAVYQGQKLGIYDKILSIEQFDIIEGEPNEWVKLAGNFKVDHLSNFLLIGSFQEDEYILNEKVDSGLVYSYYLIDDVLIKPLEPILLQDTIGHNQKLTLNNILFDFWKEVFIFCVILMMKLGKR